MLVNCDFNIKLLLHVYQLSLCCSRLKKFNKKTRNTMNTFIYSKHLRRMYTKHFWSYYKIKRISFVLGDLKVNEIKWLNILAVYLICRKSCLKLFFGIFKKVKKRSCSLKPSRLWYAWRAGCPWAWWWRAWRGWRTSWCPQRVRPSRPQKLPEIQKGSKDQVIWPLSLDCKAPKSNHSHKLKLIKYFRFAFLGTIKASSTDFSFENWTELKFG